MARGDGCVVKPDRVERARPEVFDDDIGFREEAIDDGTAVGVLEVDRDALLVAVDAQVVRAFAFDERRTPRARVVAARWMLDLDDPRAHVGRKHRAVRSREHAREIENRDAGQRAVAHRDLSATVTRPLRSAYAVFSSPPSRCVMTMRPVGQVSISSALPWPSS